MSIRNQKLHRCEFKDDRHPVILRNIIVQWYNNRNLTIEADDAVGDEEHEEDENTPAEDLGHPPAVVQLIAGVLLILDPGHQKRQDGEEQEVPEANAEHRIALEPLAIRSTVEVIDP